MDRRGKRADKMYGMSNMETYITMCKMDSQHLLDHRKSKGISKRKTKPSTSASLTMLKPSTVWITTNWEILEEVIYQATLPVS